MTGRHPRPARYQLTFHPAIETDPDTLDPDTLDPDTLDAAQAILDDLAYGRVTGKALGARHVSGDLTGLARVKFDTPSGAPNASGSSTARLTRRPSTCSSSEHETSTPSTAPPPTGSAAPTQRTLTLPKIPGELGAGPISHDRLLSDVGELVIPALSAESVPSEADALRDDLMEILPRPRLASLLIEMDNRIGFTDALV